LLDQRRGRLSDAERDVAYGDVERLRDLLQRGDERVFGVSLYVLVRARTRQALEERTERVETALDHLLLVARSATFEQDLAFASCLPQGRDLLRRARLLDTSSAATAFPFTSSSLSMADGVLCGVVPHNGSLVILDPFAPELENANKVVFAKSGAGKSYACKVEALRSLLAGTDVIVIDPEDEYQRLCAAVGGQSVWLAPGSRQHLNPFDLPLSVTRDTARDGNDGVESGPDNAELTDASDDEGENNEAGDVGDALADKVQSLHALLDLMLADRGPAGSATLSQREKGLLDRALYETYRRAGISADPRTHTRPAPLLRDLHDILRDEACGRDETGLADRLHRYVGGSLARLFSAPTDLALDQRLVVFDVRDLDGELRPLGLFLIADFVWTRVRRDRHHPRLLLIDEAWSLIQHAEGGRFLASLARRARKYYLGLVTITQDVEDFLGSEWGRTVLANSSVQLLMKQDSTTIEAVTQAFRLSGGERQYLLGCHKGEGLLFARGSHVAIRVEASPLEHELATTDPRELAARAARVQRTSSQHTLHSPSAASMPPSLGAGYTPLGPVAVVEQPALSSPPRPGTRRRTQPLRARTAALEGREISPQRPDLSETPNEGNAGKEGK
jgi:type IV secretory pathway VirB4 component